MNYASQRYMRAWLRYVLCVFFMVSHIGDTVFNVLELKGRRTSARRGFSWGGSKS